MNDQQAALFPCPFCANAAELEDDRLLWVVRCTKCSACVLGDRAPGPKGDMPDSYWDAIKQTAIEAWNRRALAQPRAPISDAQIEEIYLMAYKDWALKGGQFSSVIARALLAKQGDAPSDAKDIE